VTLRRFARHIHRRIACSTRLANGHAEEEVVRDARRYSAKAPADPTVPQDRGYSAISALALAVEAAEALALLSDCDHWPDAAARPFERAAL
jgi:hypothetical protein